MPGSNAFPTWDGQPGFKRLRLVIKPDGTNAVTVPLGGPAIKAARTGVGLITITLDDNYPALGGFDAEVGGFLAHDVRPGVYTARPAGGGPSTLTLTTFADGTTGAAAADIAVGANNLIYCMIDVTTSSGKV